MFIRKKTYPCTTVLNNGENILALVDRLRTEMKDRLFDEIKNALVEKIKQTINNDCTFDTKTLDYYRKIIKCYEDCISLYNQQSQNITMPKTRAIMEGVISVLSSQIAVFNDNFNSSPDPISTEKELIIGSIINFFKIQLNLINKAFVKELLEEKSFWRKLIIENFCLLKNHMLQKLNAVSMAGIYKIYIDSLNYCNAALNDLSSREHTSLCIELLKKEQEALSSIIVVQVSALEDNAALSENKDEGQFVAEVITKLQEGHQILGKNLKEITDFFKEHKTRKTEQLKDFADELAEYLNSKELMPLKEVQATQLNLSTAQESLSKTLASALEKETHGVYYKKSVYELQKQSTQHHFLLNEILNAFSKIEEYINQNKDELSKTPEADIVNGILETMQIKIETMREQKSQFQDKCMDIVNKLKDEEIPIMEDDLLALNKQAYEGWLKDELNLNEIIKPIKQARNTIQTKYADQLTAYCLDLIVNCILYEIRTFEEITHHSVAKLQESTSEVISDLVEFISGISKSIEMILKKNDIIPLKPKPHDKFNALLHMIILAQDKEDFNRGEIIKLMNTGYIQGERILLRANVIAAK